MDGDVFAEDIVIPDADARGCAVVFQILRRIADDAARVETVAGPHDSKPVR